MGLFLTLRIALRAIAKNKMRAGLTVLGVVIGVAAVIAMVSIGQGAGAMVQSQFSSLGTNVIVIIPGTEMGGGGVRQGLTKTLTADDSDAIAKECPNVLASSPLISAQAHVIYRNSNWSPNELVGVDASYLTVRNWQIKNGGFFTERDVKAAGKVCVIGETLVGKLFQTTNPLGKTVRIKNIPFVVIGVLEPKGANLVGQDQDNILMAPYTTVRKRINGSAFDNVDALIVSARSVERMPEAQTEITQLLQERHRIHAGSPDDFVVRNTDEIASIFGIVTGIMTALLASIAGISLLVGGVGIMNIMLVSVTERTREIGIRLAVGARGRDILRQFLVEAIVLSGLGGIVGITIGVGSSVGITMIINAVTTGTKWPIVISIPGAVIAMAFACAVGMFFGYYPARRASRLDPIDALRYE